MVSVEGIYNLRYTKTHLCDCNDSVRRLRVDCDSMTSRCHETVNHNRALMREHIGLHKDEDMRVGTRDAHRAD